MHTREEKLAAFGRLLDVQHRLRCECPWDKKQTLESLRPNTIEEVFELADALMKGDYHEIMKELGDVMEHVMFYALIGNEQGEFDMADICNREADKLMFRHPFIDWNKAEGEWGIENEPFTVSQSDMRIDERGQVVYVSVNANNTGHSDSANNSDKGYDKPTTESAVEQSWEQIKQQERDGNTSVLSGVPRSLPSLIKAYRIQDKARNVGFDWKEREQVWDKVREELGELEVELAKDDKENSEKELGDFLFSVINAARLYKLNPDNALELTNRKFISRFNYVEQKVLAAGKQFGELTLNEMDAWWNEAKALEKS